MNTILQPKEENYWVTRLSSYERGQSNLPADFPRPKTYDPSAAATLAVSFPQDLCEELGRLTKGSPFLLYAALVSALKVCLQKYSGSRVTAVGSPARVEGVESDGRPNALVIIHEVAGGESFKQLLLGVRNALSQAYANQRYPFAKLVSQLGLSEAGNRCPLFDVALSLRGFHGELPAVRNDITIEVGESSGALAGEIRYDARLFRRESVERFARHWVQALRAGLSNLEAACADIEVMTHDERARLLEEWDLGRNHDLEKLCAHELFERQASLTPGDAALSFEDRVFSYEEVNEKANQVAHYLRLQGVGPEVLVGIYAERSPEMVIGLLAVLKAGGAYVPVDPVHPRERVATVLSDARVRLALTTDALAANLPQGIHTLRLDADWEALIAGRPTHNPRETVSPENLAYVMYTSGSTGIPKGVSMPHRPLVNLVEWQRGNFTRTRGARTLQFTSLSFDVSFQEIFSTWCSGGTLVLISDEERRDLAALPEFLARRQIDRLFMTPSALQRLAESASARQLASLKEVIVGGEVLRISDSLIGMFEKTSGATLSNHYGPTETHVMTALRLEGAPRDWPARPTIGRAIPGTRIYFLDSGMRPAPVGAVGELYIGGLPLSRGYFNRPALTAERFVPDPFGAEPGGRVYRTGDVARYLTDGEIDFIGRIDRQVKIRGFRVELGEVEATLLKHPAVEECIVVSRPDERGEPSLSAYVVGNGGAELSVRELRDFLKERLPEQMLPSAFFRPDRLPLTPNGKVDHRALLALEHLRMTDAGGYQAPRNPTEEALVKIWSEVLQTERVGVHDNFFELGGHSLLATQVVSRMREAFHLEVPLRAFFIAPTVADMAETIEAMQAQTPSTGGQLQSAPDEGRGLDELIARIESLSEEEVQALLDKGGEGGFDPVISAGHDGDAK
jgi:amino acid adenylation domain-containing protein